MANTIQFGYAGLSLSYDPQAGMPLLDLLAAAREVRATLDAAAQSPAPPAAPARPSGTGTRPGRNPAPDRPKPPPRTAREAEDRFYARYGQIIGGTTWQAVQRYLGRLQPNPASVEEWIAVAEEIRDRAA